MKSLLPILALTSLAVACSDDAKSSDVTDSTAASTTIEVIDPSMVPVYRSDEVCELVSQEVASETLGVDVTEVATSELETPQCSYNFTTADGTSSNLTLAVQRPNEDLSGLAGKEGFDLATSLVIFDTPYEPLAGLGDEAAISASATFTIIAVLASDQVFTIATSAPIEVANLIEFGKEVIVGFTAPDSVVTTDTIEPTDAPTTDAATLANGRAQAALDTLPTGWTGTIADHLGEEADDASLVPCVGLDAYNLDNLDSDSAAVWELIAEGPKNDVFGGPQASVESRVFFDETTAAAAYAVLVTMLGTQEGRDCLASEMPAQLAADASEGSTFSATVEATTLEGPEVGSHIVVTFDSDGLTGEYHIDIVAAMPDALSTTFATFISFDGPVDHSISSAMFIAANTG